MQQQGLYWLAALNESSHMISMLMVLFEIITSYSLYTRSKVMWEITIKTS